MPTLRLDADEQIVISDEVLNREHLSRAGWVFDYARTQKPLMSSKRKLVLSGTYFEPDTLLSGGIPACAVEFPSKYLTVFGSECASLAKANTAGAGPKILQIHACPSLLGTGAEEGDLKRGLIIEEDVGITLASAIERHAIVPGLRPAPLHALGTPERDKENAKIKFDVFSQLYNLHANGMYHRDLRVSNVCVRRFGEKPEDIRATIIDFELIADVSKWRLEAAAPEYLETIFKGKTFLLPIEIDMGFLAAFCFELDEEQPVAEAGPDFYAGERYPFYRLSNGTIHVRRLVQTDLDELAAECNLVPVTERGMAELTGERLALQDIVECVSSLVKHGGYLDGKDIALLEEDPEFIILSNRERIAIESYGTYLEQVRAQGDEPEFESFYDQPIHQQESGLDNVTKYRAKVEILGYRIVPKRALRDVDEIKEFFDPEEIEKLAVIEHNRWMDERKSKGFTWGSVKDLEKREHPDLVPYEQLPEKKKDRDRRNIRNMIPFLREVGLYVCR